MTRDLPFGNIRDTYIRVPCFSVVLVFMILEALNALRSITKLIDSVVVTAGTTDEAVVVVAFALAVTIAGTYDHPPPPQLLFTTTLSV